MAKKETYEEWTEADILQQIKWLQELEPMSLRHEDKALEFHTRIISIATLQEDKQWSYKNYLAAPELILPELPEKESKFVQTGLQPKGMMPPHIRVSREEVYHFCLVNEPILGADLIHRISQGDEEAAEELALARDPKGFEESLGYRLRQTGRSNSISFAELFDEADSLYETDEWMEFFPYAEQKKYWLPKQEIDYLYSLLEKKKSEKEIEKPGSRSESLSSQPTQSAEKVEKKEDNMNKVSDKNYLIAAILAILLGSFGAHKFYVGKMKYGIIYLIFYWTWIPGLLGIIEGVKYLMGGQEKFIESITDNS